MSLTQFKEELDYYRKINLMTEHEVDIIKKVVNYVQFDYQEHDKRTISYPGVLFSDEESHEVENLIDGVLDLMNDDELSLQLRDIRDTIPCSCGVDQP